MFSLEPEIPLSDEEFRLIRDLIYNHCGLYFDSDATYLLEKRLAKRLQFHHLAGFRDYYHFLKYNRNRDQELSDIMDLLTTNETYFFREAFQLKAFTDEIIPALRAMKMKSGDRTLRIWSAGCSSGEEPYTIAMLLLEMGGFAGWQVEIIGTDICQRVIQQARKGFYGKSSFRVTDDSYIRRYFTEQDGMYRVNDKVRELVTISHLNLLDANRIALLGRMDVIYCRNVIIYFDQLARRKVIDSFYRTLREGGYLLLGHSESLMNISTAFILKHFKNDMVYQKPFPGGAGGGL
ncbi:protein-glutamate O-methyltransferase CheR [Geobacter hydrogenophilus]|uniref:protein-glutamate O-methyltransferase n=1 Tax=Geobacter hydrogenophilus TaxID=40983 RepID=A0A9W6G3C3_9BACT|nr:protein-glutamate O-methyltransferase CheR [Geobacter hydrogenophilus]MBT0892259.1 protein-glutamate O-methyltransferase CheR [Geobacter hydrogenophilus]GLI39652.1 chemotaxis protein methyltransferase [Geobacter hydrogenophilus]